ncbi:transcriptional repressor LexA [Garciella nitratireducens]|uniref:LexA repressor n=1 Tax=Garciella nitratireducens DSM 15102 TaxID=1121911 RepID=A0A1T4JVG3_9FIRM|nr:transcriptional repressor LexA [Garciella nitratireducens]RBP45608.1 SOS-response transcriptional repressor LexA [Garciella nitratireducens]SJZ34222.1 SOS-response transcriptional repressor, LexA [Garciella nitratireducens DSM 15102]
MYENISDKQLKILEFIKEELYHKGYPPSVREICNAVGLKSTSTVHGHLEKLEKYGYIRRDPTKPRAIEVLDHNPYFSENELVEIPVIGKVTAGKPILAVENIEDIFTLPLNYLDIDNHNSFILIVRGTSMINAGILDGDYVIVRQQNVAQNGDIIVALLGEEATIKRFFKEKDHIRLQPENPDMEPIIVTNIKILGKVVGVFRKL